MNYVPETCPAPPDPEELARLALALSKLPPRADLEE